MSLGQTGWKSQLHFFVEVWGPERLSKEQQVTQMETEEKVLIVQKGKQEEKDRMRQNMRDGEKVSPGDRKVSEQ